MLGRVLRPHFFKKVLPAAANSETQTIWTQPLFLHNLICVGVGLASLYSAHNFVLLLCVTLPRVLIYFLYLDLAQNISLEFLELTPTAGEGEVATLRWKIRNKSLYPLVRYSAQCDFPAHLSGQMQKLTNQSIAAFSESTTEENLDCNTGVGIFKVKEFTLTFSDAFGFYLYEVSFAVDLKLRVHPKTRALNLFESKPSSQSELYGLHELKTRGLSVNFTGLRAYHFGDSIKRIAWRPTAKHNQLMVKEFEKIVNSEVHLVIDLNPNHHLGVIEFSTWNTARDLAFAIASQCLEVGNSVSLACNSGYLEKGFGQDQLQQIIETLISIDIMQQADENFSGGHFEMNPFQRWSTLVPNVGGTVVLVDSLLYPAFRQHQLKAQALLSQGNHLVIFAIRPVLAGSPYNHSQLEAQAHRNLMLILEDLEVRGAEIFCVTPGTHLTKQVHRFNLKHEQQGLAP